MINKIFSVLIIFLALNCKSTENQAKMANEAVVLIAKGNLYGAGAEGIKKQHLVITERQDWNNLITKLNSVNNVSNGFTETAIDFSKYTVIAVFDEVKTSGGYSVELDIASHSDKTVIKVTQNSPDGMATAVMTQPYYIAKVSKTNLPIEFQ
ncbi:protease complex subunit PrcB family protein [Winogradskyella flava]|uniref:protease complex subunit PrcB family protein n=1 Tax=Winogradskyella flava TaxID=1884876 RepID=UPI001C8D93AB|nr:protease complex subunit PrcB family protein [Winogradskyella flava]